MWHMVCFIALIEANKLFYIIPRKYCLNKNAFIATQFALDIDMNISKKKLIIEKPLYIDTIIDNFKKILNNI